VFGGALAACSGGDDGPAADTGSGSASSSDDAGPEGTIHPSSADGQRSTGGTHDGSEGAAEPTTSSAPTSESTTGGPSTGDDGTTGDDSSTGEPAPAGYGDCANEPTEVACTPEETCAYDVAPPGRVCAQPCQDASDCPPAPRSGSATATCRSGECVLDCAEGSMCPDGMACAQGETCTWPLQPPGGGRCPDVDLGNTVPTGTFLDTTATADDHTPSCAFRSAEDMLTTFTAPFSGGYAIGLGGYGPVGLFVLDGCGGEELACTTNSEAELFVHLVRGQTIVIGFENTPDTSAMVMDIAYEPAGSCCAATWNLGCDDPEVEACVCEIQSWCCLAQWDQVCEVLAADPCGAPCS
jgi:hypothetical protein